MQATASIVNPDHFAIRGDLESVKKYMSHMNGFSMEQAARHGHIECVQAMYEAGVPAEWTLRTLLANGDRETAEWMLEQDPEDGMMILEDACKQGNLDLVKFMIPHNYKDIILMGRRNVPLTQNAYKHATPEVYDFLLSRVE